MVFTTIDSPSETGAQAISKEVELKHFAMTPFIAVCGADEPNQMTTRMGSGATCPACIEWMKRQGESTQTALQEKRDAAMRGLTDMVQELEEAFRQLRDDIIKNAHDTVWVGPGETACERITSILGDDWGKDGKCEARQTPKVTSEHDCRAHPGCNYSAAIVCNKCGWCGPTTGPRFGETAPAVTDYTHLMRNLVHQLDRMIPIASSYRRLKRGFNCEEDVDEARVVLAEAQRVLNDVTRPAEKLEK